MPSRRTAKAESRLMGRFFSGHATLEERQKVLHEGFLVGTRKAPKLRKERAQ